MSSETEKSYSDRNPAVYSGSARSSRSDVRNPVLGLPGISAIQSLPLESRIALMSVLLDLRRDAQAKAEKAWLQHKAPMAAYWKAVAVYSGHIARAIRPHKHGEKR